MLKRFSGRRRALMLAGSIFLALGHPTATWGQAAHVDQRSALESRFISGLSAAGYGENMKELTSRPTYPGSPFSAELAAKILARFRSYGWNAKVETYEIPYPRVTTQAVELLGPRPFKAALRESPVPGDAYTLQDKEIIEPFFVMGPDGDVTAPLVYVNFGLRDDYARLAKMGVDVRGKIVIARYGRLFRGGKVELAAEHGALGVLIYSDPHEDGYFVEPTYPEGQGRTPTGVQRGSVLQGKFLGDPTTPGYASKKGVQRLPVFSEKSNFARIPAVPLSYSDAQPLLEALHGQVVPESWRGALPITYKVGPSEAKVHLLVQHDRRMVTIRNVIATLRGSEFPDEYVIRGNHHDGWVFGADDPHSGHSAMLEEARSLGALYKSGWRPKRTIIYASWDAEESALIGSSEFVEDHLEDLRSGGVIYLNTDMAGVGSIALEGASTYSNFATRLLKDVKDPDSGLSLWDRFKLAHLHDIYAEATAGSVTGGGSASGVDFSSDRIRLGIPGYGSDHQAFFAIAGMGGLNSAFFGDSAGNSSGAYHSDYDDYEYYTRFMDPGFRYGMALAQLNGLAVLRVASAHTLPVEFTAVAEQVDAEVKRLVSLNDRLAEAIRHDDSDVRSGAYIALNDPRRPRLAPPIRPAPSLDFAPLERAAARIEACARAYAQARESGLLPTRGPDVARLNRALMAVDRAFLRSDGLPGRPFYRHEMYSPGRVWDSPPFPAVSDAMSDGDWETARKQIPLAAATLNSVADAIDEATKVLVQLRKTRGATN
jgi:N-acetylated-alpha-linked acidic dipeptidase